MIFIRYFWAMSLSGKGKLIVFADALAHLDQFFVRGKAAT